MDVGTAVLFGVVLVLAINQAIMRVERLASDDRAYFAVQFIDIAVAAGLILYGMPGMEAFPAVPPVLGLLFLMHVAQNYNARSLRIRAEQDDEREAIEAEAQRLRDTRSPEEDLRAPE